MRQVKGCGVSFGEAEASTPSSPAKCTVIRTVSATSATLGDPTKVKVPGADSTACLG